MGLLFQEWRADVNSEAKNSSKKELILTADVQYSPDLDTVSFPVDSIRSNLNWVHVMAYDYHMPEWSNNTGAHAALYGPSSQVNTDYVVGIKVSYARERKLLGYFVWQVPYDNNWLLSLVAQEEQNNGRPKWRLLVIVLTTAATFALLLCLILVCYLRMRMLKSKAKKLESKVNYLASAGDSDSNVPHLQVFSLADIEAATDKFSFENKLGEGGYGPVFKGVLPNGKEIAVKKLSKTSTQGFEEFKNEVMFTAKLQHVNLVRVLGFCVERDEQMLIYEYMPNKSLDFYLFDPIRQKDEHEANTDRIVGTYGYVPPEYVQKGSLVLIISLFDVCLISYFISDCQFVMSNLRGDEESAEEQ
nr:g-type lectin s-receptor-like serine/threonine-protein kinase [Quercus suber]